MRNIRRIATAAVAAGMITAGLGTSAASARTLGQVPSGYHFQTVDNNRDVTFNQLLGINDLGVIAGYFGSGAAGHPNQGYQLLPPYQQGRFVNENFPGSAQTQVTGLNNRGVTVGFWSGMNNANLVDDNHGFVSVHGHFRTADFPTGAAASPPVDQLLGVNDSDIAVGFWADAAGNNHGYEYDINRGRFSSITQPGVTSLIATAINNRGDVAGSYTTAAGNTDGFLKAGRSFIDLAVPGATATQAFGVNNRDEVVGAYAIMSGGNILTHGFTWTPAGGFRTVDDPHGLGNTTINGVNDLGDLVGFYGDAAGNTNGLVAIP